ncbi:MAG: class I mannose-6-phosphate isomerase [Clostridia bacterium]|nr:class I mannose-6-phosphate isomerase [Clostridia bacterium]
MDVVKLYPECKDYIWGGEKLKQKYGKVTDKTPCAESWELSFHKDGLTRLESGKTLAETVSEKDLGELAKDFPFFPVLIKFIDAEQNLSVQVHPSDDYALKNENSFGKTEMWYVVEAEEGAGLYVGFNRDVTKSEFEQAIAENRLTELLNFFEVKAGDCYFIPSGTIHAIAKGCLICEIQQNSNLTYRVYDYGRKDKNGKERELHVEKALAVTSLKKYEPINFSGNVLGTCKYFHVEKLSVKEKTNRATDEKSFHCLTCMGGRGALNGKTVSCGDSFFVPANHGEYTLEGDMEIVVTSI